MATLPVTDPPSVTTAACHLGPSAGSISNTNSPLARRCPIGRRVGLDGGRTAGDVDAVEREAIGSCSPRSASRPDPLPPLGDLGTAARPRPRSLRRGGGAAQAGVRTSPASVPRGTAETGAIHGYRAAA